MGEKQVVRTGDVVSCLTRNGIDPVTAFRWVAYILPKWREDGTAFLRVNGNEWDVHVAPPNERS